MFTHYRTQAFILKESPRRETDKVFMVFTKDFGKIEILAKAVRKTKSKLRGNVPPFSISEIGFVQGKAYKILTDALLVRDFENIKKDLNKLKFAYKISGFLEKLIRAPEKDEAIWRLLKETFEVFDNPSLPFDYFSLIYFYFLWNLLSILGYRSQIYKCLNCQNKLKPDGLFFSARGGLICETCSKKEKSKLLKVDVNTVKILREILKNNLSHLLKLKFKKEHQKPLKELSSFYLSFFPSEI